MRSHRSGRFARAAVIAAALALTAGACGGDDDDDDAADTATAETEESVAPETTAAAETATEEPAETSAPADSAATTAPEETSAPETTEAPEQELDLDATLTVAMTNPLQTLDPHGGASPSTGTMPWTELIYDRLVGLGPELTLEPMLATDWSYSDDGLTFTVNLRDDAVFSDGTPLTAEAVKLSIERLKNFEGAREAGEIASVDSVEAVDDLTAVFHLNRPDAALPYTLASAVGMILSPNVVAAPDVTDTPVGIGPYIVTEYAAGDHVTYERNPNYWNPEVQNFAQITQRFVVDDNARLNGLQSGEFDVIYVSSSQVTEAEDLASSGDFGLHRAPAWGYEYMWLNLDKVPDYEVRKAMIQAIDRQAIADQLFAGDCAVTTQPQGEGMIGHDPAIEDLYSYDPDAAAEVIAGLPEAPSLTMAVIPSSPNGEISVVVEQQLEQVGFNLELTQGDSAAQFGAFAQGQVDGIPAISASAPFYQGAIMTPTFMALAHTEGNASPEILALQAQASDATLSDAEREQIITDINRMWAEELLAIPICRTGIKTGYAANVVGVEDMRFPISRRVMDVRHLGKTAG